MVIGYIEQLLLLGIYPLLMLVALAFGTMAVAAAIITDMDTVAYGVGAFVDMTAQQMSTATHQGIECAQLPTVGNDFFEPVLAAKYDLRYFITGVHQL